MVALTYVLLVGICATASAGDISDRQRRVQQLTHHIDHAGAEELLQADGTLAEGLHLLDDSPFIVAASCLRGHLLSVAVPAAAAAHMNSCAAAEEHWCGYRTHPASWKLGELIIGGSRWGCAFDWHTETPLAVYLELSQSRPAIPFRIDGPVPAGGLVFYTWEVDPQPVFAAFEHMKWRAFHLPTSAEFAPEDLHALQVQDTPATSGVDAAGRKLLRGPSVLGSPGPVSSVAEHGSKHGHAAFPHMHRFAAGAPPHCRRGIGIQPGAAVPARDEGVADAASTGAAAEADSPCSPWAAFALGEDGVASVTAASQWMGDEEGDEDKGKPAASGDAAAARWLQAAIKHDVKNRGKFELKMDLTREEDGDNTDSGVDITLKAAGPKFECDVMEETSKCFEAEEATAPTRAGKNVYGWKYLASKDKGWKPEGGVKLIIDLGDTFIDFKFGREWRWRWAQTSRMQARDYRLNVLCSVCD